MKGSMLDVENLPKLEAAQEQLAAIKVKKLRARHEKNQGSEMSLTSALDHLSQEYAECMEAIAASDRDHIMEELADLSNMVDIFATLVLWEI